MEARGRWVPPATASSATPSPCRPTGSPTRRDPRRTLPPSPLLVALRGRAVAAVSVLCLSTCSGDISLHFHSLIIHSSSHLFIHRIVFLVLYHVILVVKINVKLPVIMLRKVISPGTKQISLVFLRSEAPP